MSPLGRGLVLLALAALTCGALASIEREPVKVDRSNAGPKYDIDDIERTRVLAENSNPDSNQVITAPVRPTDSSSGGDGRDDSSHQDAPMISIRRILLVPMMPPSTSSSGNSGDNDERSVDPMRMFGGPRFFAPFSSRHLFGGDEASRPAPDESRERPVMSPSSSSSSSGEEPNYPTTLFNPIEAILEAFRESLNTARMLPPPPPQEATDLNKEASGENKPSSETGVEKKPQSYNSTKEDIIEVDGKKYLRKSVVQHHVGDGIVFTTRRLIFSPLNETETESGNKETTPSATTTSEPATEQPATSKVEKIDEPAGSSTISPMASEPASSKEPAAVSETPSPPPTEASSTTVAAADKEDTTAKSVGEKITETVSRVERLMEKMIERKDMSGSATTTTTTTDKPSS